MIRVTKARWVGWIGCAEMFGKKMKDSVSKSISEVVWVGVRVLGLYLLVKGLLPLLWYLLLASSLKSNEVEPFSTATQLGAEGQFGQLMVLGHASNLLQFAVGVYLLFFGKTIHRLITSIPSASETHEDGVDEQSKSSMRKMQRLYKDFMVSQGAELADNPKERHEQFRRWLAD